MWCLVLLILLLGEGCRRAESCSVCTASNSTCRLVSGIFTRPQLPMGYNLIAQIPQGVCNLTVMELKHSRNYLALRRTDGSFVLNGNWAINWSGDFNVDGDPFSYTRDDESHVESIFLAGPLHDPLDLMVIYQQPNPGIKYQYQIPMVQAELTTDEAINTPPLFKHTTTNHIEDHHKLIEEHHIPFQNQQRMNEDQLSSFEINTGSDKRRVTSGLPVGSTDPHSYPGDQAAKARPKRKRKFAWKITGFTDCSKSCGGGIQTAIVSCVREYNQLTVTDKRCVTFDKPPPSMVRCNVKPCVAEWAGGEWSECSVTCGEGVEIREIVCRQEISSTLVMTVAEGACLTPPSPLLHRIRTCHHPPCNSSWQTGLWSQCSISCGLGVRTRSVTCPSNTCSLSDKPTTESVCDMGPCLVDPANTTWFYTEWSQQCSEGCGTGVQTRRVYCSDDQCPTDSQPDTSRACSSDKLCGAQWFTGPWGQCTVSCGGGQQSRNVICIAKTQEQTNIVSEDHCLASEKPDVEQPCQLRSCGSEWYSADWSQCSRSCDTGVQRRDVNCLDEQQELSAGCREEDKPSTRRACNTNTCTADGIVETTLSPVDNHNPRDQPLNSANDPECKDHYHNCQLVVQARLCIYKYYRTPCCQSCHNKMW